MWSFEWYIAVQSTSDQILVSITKHLLALGTSTFDTSEVPWSEVEWVQAEWFDFLKNLSCKNNFYWVIFTPKRAEESIVKGVMPFVMFRPCFKVVRWVSEWYFKNS